MDRGSLLVVFSLWCLCSMMAPGHGKAVNLLDMTAVFDNQTIYWPQGQQTYFHHNVTLFSSTNVEWLQRGSFSAGEHGGTHMDAPIHFAKGKWSLDEIPLGRLMSLPVVVLDVKNSVNQDNEYLASKEDALKWESKYGRIPDGAAVLLCTGWESRWPDISQVYNYGSAAFEPANFNFPGFGGDLCEWLVTERKVYGVGTDSPSVDGSASLTTVIAHQTLYPHNIWGLEQLKGTCQLPSDGARITALPIRIGNGSGGPARVVATWGEQDACAAGSGNNLQGKLLILVILTAITYSANKRIY